jgi:hypothetical protein
MVWLYRWAQERRNHGIEGTCCFPEYVAWEIRLLWQNFCPIANYQIVVEQLVAGNCIPLGKYLLGVVYHLLHQVAFSLSTNSPIGTPGGPWRFINMWLNLHLRDRLEQNICTKTFPADQPDGVSIVRHRCMNFGEAVSIIPRHKRTHSRIA